MREEKFILRLTYLDGEYVPSDEQVAIAVMDARSSHNRWADLSDQGNHKVITWDSEDGELIRKKDVFYRWENDLALREDIRIYENGLTDLCVFDSEKAANWMIDTCQKFDDEKGAIIRDLDSREEEIIAIGKHWLHEYWGREIEKRPIISNKLLSADEIRLFTEECVIGNWPDQLMRLGFNAPLRPSGLIPVNQAIRSDLPQYSWDKRKYTGLWQQVEQLAKIYYAKSHHFTKATS